MDSTPQKRITVTKATPVSRLAEYLESQSTWEDAAVVVLPLRITDDGTAVYRADEAGLVKTARAHDVPVSAVCDAGDLKYASEYSAANEILFAIGLGVAGNVTTDILKYIVALVRLRLAVALGRHNPAPDSGLVAVEIDRISRDAGGKVELHGLKLTIPSEIFEDNDQTIAGILGPLLEDPPENAGEPEE